MLTSSLRLTRGGILYVAMAVPYAGVEKTDCPGLEFRSGYLMVVMVLVPVITVVVLVSELRFQTRYHQWNWGENGQVELFLC